MRNRNERERDMETATRQSMFVITHDGQTAWEWNNPKNRIRMADLSVTADEWKARMESVGIKIVDDRNQPAGNVWD